jgi:hypothetical protein
LQLNPACGDEVTGMPIVLVATKCDLPHQISGQELLAFAKKYRTGLAKVSAKDGTRVVEAFEECASYAAARRLDSMRRSERPEKRGKGCVLM